MSDSPGARGGDELPEAARRALEQLPPGFEKALEQAPPEVREALAGFREGVEVDIEGVDLASALSGTPVEPAGVVERLPHGLVEGLEGTEVTGDRTLGFATTAVSAPKQRLELRFDRDAYGPGDAIEGTIVARERLKARQLEVGLGYVEQSPSYVEQTIHDDAGNLRQGNLEPGHEVRFALRMPAGAPPNWDPAGALGTPASGGQAVLAEAFGDLGLAAYGGLYWAIVVTATRRGVVANTVERHPVPLAADPALWPGPDAGAVAPGVEGAVKSWDVSLEASPWAPRRGEEVVLDLAIGSPSPGRSLRAGLICEIHYDVETESHTTSDGHDHTTSSRSTHVALAHEEWVPVDASTSSHRIGLRVPAEAPFSHGEPRGKALAGGKVMFSRSKLRHDCAFSVVWRASVCEDKRMRRDPHRTARLHVLP